MRLELLAGKLVRETTRSAGFDLFSHEPDRIIIAPQEFRGLRVGVKAEFEAGYVALLWDKSGYALRNGICVLGGMIDGDYTKEWLAILLNMGKEPFIINPGDKVTQVIFVKLAEVECIALPGAYCNSNDKKRDGGFGSTGNT